MRGLAGLRSVVAPVEAAISRPQGTSPERFGPKALFRKVGGRYQVRPGTAPHPSGLRPATLSQERVFPTPGPGFARSTFPDGEGDLRRGHSLTFPWGKVPPQRRKRGGTKSVLRTAPHPSRLHPATLSLREVFFSKILYFHQKQKNCFDKRIERTYNKYNGIEWG